jgi:hypothetical protein
MSRSFEIELTILANGYFSRRVREVGFLLFSCVSFQWPPFVFFPAPCPYPLRQAWGSVDALVGHLRAAFEENGGRPESNPFAARAVRLFLCEVREHQSHARGVSYE